MIFTLFVSFTENDPTSTPHEGHGGTSKTAIPTTPPTYQQSPPPGHTSVPMHPQGVYNPGVPSQMGPGMGINYNHPSQQTQFGGGPPMGMGAGYNYQGKVQPMQMGGGQMVTVPGAGYGPDSTEQKPRNRGCWLCFGCYCCYYCCCLISMLLFFLVVYLGLMYPHRPSYGGGYDERPDEYEY